MHDKGVKRCAATRSTAFRVTVRSGGQRKSKCSERLDARAAQVLIVFYFKRQLVSVQVLAITLKQLSMVEIFFLIKD